MTTAVSAPADVWTLDASGAWSLAANWSSGVPHTGSNVVIAPAKPSTITFNTGNLTLGDFTLANATLVLTGGALTASAGATLLNASLGGSHALIASGVSEALGVTVGGSASLQNKGAMWQAAGALVIGDSKASTAQIDNLAGATWTDADGSKISQASSAGFGFVNSGVFDDAYAAGTTTISANFQSTGTITVAAGGTLVLAGPSARLSGLFNGDGVLEYGAGDVATISSFESQASEQLNLGVVDQTGGMDLFGDQTIVNERVWDIVGDNSLLVGVGEGAGITFNNNAGATLTKTAGTGDSVVGANVVSDGRIVVMTGTLEFAGDTNFFEGLIAGPGTVEIALGSSYINAAPSLTITVAHFVLAGGTTTMSGVVTDAGAFEGDDGATLALGETLEDHAPVNGVLKLAGPAVLAGLDVTGVAGASQPDQLVVQSTATVSGLTVGGAAQVIDAGTVTQTGAVVIGDSATSKAEIVVSAGATWNDAGDRAISQHSGAGYGFVNNGTFDDAAASGTATIAANFESTGTISVAQGGTLAFTGKSSSISGSFIGDGVIEYGPGDVATLGSVSSRATDQTNLGLVDQVSGMDLFGDQTIVNKGRWNIVGDNSILVGVGEGAGIDFSGYAGSTLAKTAGTGDSVFGANAYVAGAVEVDTGALQFAGDTDVFSGPITGAGTFAILTGNAEFGTSGAAGQTISVGHFVLAGGTTTMTGAVTDTGAFEGDDDATLALGGNAFTLVGAANLTGLDVTAGPGASSGSLIIEGATQFSGATVGGAQGLVELVVQGGVVRQAGGNLTLGGASGNGTGNLVLGFGGVWDIADASGVALGAAKNSIIGIAPNGNSSLLEKTGAGVSAIAPAVVNNAVDIQASTGLEYRGIEAAAGTLDLQNVVSGTGSDNIVGAATLEFDSGVAATQTVSFFGKGGTLELNDLRDFSAAIDSFDTTGSNDALLLGGNLKYVGVHESATQAILDFTQGATTRALTLTGDYLGVGFTVQVQSSGVLKVTA